MIGLGVSGSNSVESIVQCHTQRAHIRSMRIAFRANAEEGSFSRRAPQCADHSDIPRLPNRPVSEWRQRPGTCLPIVRRLSALRSRSTDGDFDSLASLHGSRFSKAL